MTNKLLKISALFLGLVSTATMASNTGESCQGASCSTNKMIAGNMMNKMDKMDKMEMMDKQANMNMMNKMEMMEKKMK